MELLWKYTAPRMGLEPTSSMAPNRIEMQGGHAIHYPSRHTQKKDGLRVSLSVHPLRITRGCEDNSQPVIQQV